MYDIFSKIAFSKIDEAIENGEFENLSGHGKPLNLDYLTAIPPEMRATYTILKNSGIVPEEVILLKEMDELKEQIASTDVLHEKNILVKKLMDTELKYKLKLETLKRD